MYINSFMTVMHVLPIHHAWKKRHFETNDECLYAVLYSWVNWYIGYTYIM